ncbi:carboxyl-terminal-processing peptidase 2, chloroplastic-like isoform X2 [Musa acuminata AAA Group]|uniref:carboxyl-terminal-processing peptidase 2, chloroplastic-like isoform X2 n=1 Tax=Musa acuminata AAA Group TaxID=214697 RepID=UPI0031D2E92C
MESNVASSSSSTFASRSLLLAVCGARMNISKKNANPHHHRHSFPVRNPPGCPLDLSGDLMRKSIKSYQDQRMYNDRAIGSEVLWRLKAHSVNVGNFAVPLQCAAFGSKRRTKFYKTIRGAGETLLSSSILQASWGHKKIHVWYVPSPFSFGNLVGVHAKIQTLISRKKEFKHNICIFFTRVVITAMLAISLSVTINKSPAWALTEENLLFLEAWRTVDRAYVDKSFNRQSWFRYRENALRNEPMNTREETYRAIKKMLSTLDDPFTRFLEPEKFKSLRSGTQGALTGVGLSIGYPLVLNGSPTGLIVVSSAPGGPADKAGIVSGDIILAIDDESTEDMDIYDAAERLQGTEGSSVKLVIHSGPEIKDVVLRREKVTFNPVKTRLCEITRSGAEKSRIGYIKLTSFNQNASVKDAIETLRSNGVKAFVLDLRNNSGGLFPEGIEIAKIWLDKGVIVYICDNRGVRDIYEADGSNTVAASEPLTVLVNKGTASASEILAGALKDNRRAVLYGEPTFGKGKIQSVFELSDGSGLAVTVARYETPAHTNIDKVGIKPDHPLPTPFPTDEEEFCSCLKDPSSPCNLSSSQLFSR